jgi:hypothetical protein
VVHQLNHNALQENPDHLAQPVEMDSLVTQEEMVNPVALDNLHLAQLKPLHAFLARQVPQDLEVLTDNPVDLDSPETLELPHKEEDPALLDLPAHKEMPVDPETTDSPEAPDNRDQMELKALDAQDLKDHRDNPEETETLVDLANLAVPANPETKDPLDQQVTPADPDNPEATVTLEEVEDLAEMPLIVLAQAEPDQPVLALVFMVALLAQATKALLPNAVFKSNFHNDDDILYLTYTIK